MPRPREEEGVDGSGVVLEKDSFVKVKCVAERRHSPLSRSIGIAEERFLFGRTNRTIFG